MPIKKNSLVEKRNVLNELRRNSMTLQELRFFSIYLSKINARDENTRKVCFPLTDFQKIMDFGRLNINQLKATTNSLLGKVINVPTERGGYTAFQLFKECTVDQDEYGEWYIEIDAHDKALPLMFDFKREYFSYELWNALRLKSNNQIRMYEILKQYEKVGSRKIQLVKLRELLGIDLNEYPRWDRFKARVLDSCQQALKENTDIKFTYVPMRNGRGGKITGIEFFISKNDNYIDQLTLDEFIEMQKCETSKSLDKDENVIVPFEFTNDKLEFLADACDNEFNQDQMQVIFDLVVQIIPFSMGKGIDLERYDYISRKYNEMKLRKPNKSRFGYLKSIITADVEVNNNGKNYKTDS